MREEGFESDLGGLLASLELSLSAEMSSRPEQGSEPSVAPEKTAKGLLSALGPRRPLRLSLSKKGRGGKLVTLLTLVPESEDAERAWLAQAVGKALGCRAWVEGEQLYLQGDQRERLTAWVTAQS